MKENHVSPVRKTFESHKLIILAGASRMEKKQITLSPSFITRVLGTTALLLVLASVAGRLASSLAGYDSMYGPLWLINVDEEQNIPTGFSTLLLFFSALILTVITLLKKYQRDPFGRYWVILSLGFLAMAFDEAFSFHERLTKPVRMILGSEHLGYFHFAWVIPAGILVLFLGLFFLRFLLNLPVKTRFAFFMAAILYVGGAVGIEIIEGFLLKLTRMGDLAYSMMSAFEEGLEMAGIIFFIRALLIYLAENYPEVVFRFTGKCEKQQE
jgi:general stress protein CsbA